MKHQIEELKKEVSDKNIELEDMKIDIDAL
jgi:hypothetical protein